jgi:hypothetical protein
MKTKEKKWFWQVIPFTMFLKFKSHVNLEFKKKRNKFMQKKEKNEKKKWFHLFTMFLKFKSCCNSRILKKRNKSTQKKKVKDKKKKSLKTNL